MIDEFAKEYLHDDLRWVREAIVWKLDGLSEYDIRRPLTPTGTNLLGLIKHLATWEARYLGEIFDRPFPEPLPRWDDEESEDGADLWATEDQTRAEIVDRYRRVWAHSDATIDAHADILREQIDGVTGVSANDVDELGRGAAFWVSRRAQIERAARTAGA